MFLSKMTGKIKYLHKIFLECLVKKYFSKASYIDSILKKCRVDSICILVAIS